MNENRLPVNRPSGTYSATNLFPALKRQAIFGKSLRDWLAMGATIVVFVAFTAAAQMTNALTDKEIQGRQLAQKLLEMRPTENFTNTGVLQIRDSNGNRLEIPVKCEVMVTSTNWASVYVATFTNKFEKLSVIHSGDRANAYIHFCFPTLGNDPLLDRMFSTRELNGANFEFAFANSDFWLCDLGLEFLHWPDQKILRGDTASGRLCKVLESTNPDPSPNGYSRVDSWIDNETLGIVLARAYDAKGKLLKEFSPKDIKKVNGQWQVGSMTIDNIQTGSRSRLVFDLNKK